MITIYNAEGTKIVDITDLEGSYCDRSIMGSNTLQVMVRSDHPVDFSLGAYAEHQGCRYTLLYPASITKRHTKDFEYTLLLHGEEELLAHCIIKDISGGIPYRVRFAITAKPIDFVRCIVDSLNEHYGGGWSAGQVLDATEQTLAFSHEYCLGALSRVAEAFGAEYSITDKVISLGRVSIMEDNPLPMSYGMGNGFRPGTGRHNEGRKSAVGKLYVQGGSRNIDYATYGAQTLLLPKSGHMLYNGHNYRTDPDGMYITCDEAVGTAEESYDGAAVYPMRSGTVTEVFEDKDGYDFTDTSIPEELNYNDYRIPGEKAVVVFQSGALTGREFALVQTKDKLSGYIHRERRFKLVSEVQDGYTMPGGNFVPKPGDKYAVFNISLPAEYLSDASRRMFGEAVRYFDSVITPPYVFSGEVDPIWAKREWLRIGGYMQPGAHILFSDPDYHPEGSVIRVTGVRTPLDKPYAPQLTLSNVPAALSVGNALSKLEAEAVLTEQRERAIQRTQQQSYEQALEHIGMVERAVEGLEGFTERIKPSVIETMGILVGSQATQFDFVAGIGSLKSVPPTINYNPATKQVTISSSFVRHQTIGITGITNSRKPSDYRYWSLSKYESPALTEEQESYYIYARVAKEGNTGVCLLSRVPIGMEEVSGYYHLLIGTLSSIIDNDRAYNRLYGYSMISPGQMVTDKIESANGRMRIDLATGEILSDHITFRRPDTGTETTLTDYIDEIDTHSPIIQDGTWWRWDGTRYVDTGEVAKGAKGDKGDRGLQGIQGAKGEQGISGNPGKDGHSFTASLRIKGDLRNGELGHYGVYPTFLYDGNDVTNIIQENFVTRFNENTGKGWSNWDQMASYDGLDLAEKGYEGPGVDIEVKATYKGLTAVAHAFVTHVRDGAPVRENLFTAKLYTFVQNDAYGAKCTHLGDGRWRVEKVAKSQRSWFDGASFYVNPIRDTKPGRYTISFRIVETSRPIRYSDSSAFSRKGQYVGNHYIDESNSPNGRLKGFSFFWGGSVTEGNKIGDYTIIDHIKIERVEEGEDPKPTAYLPHPDDLKGEKGDRGLQGLQGKDGMDGLPGRDGKDGKTSYTHIAYADTATGGGFSQSPAGKSYIGMYVDFVQTDSTDPIKYRWSLIKGADGKNGTPGKPGTDGRTPYLHIAYCKRPTDLTLLDRLPNSCIDDEGNVKYDNYTDLLYMVPVQAGEILKLDNTVAGEWYRIVFHAPDGKVVRSLRYNSSDKTKNQWTIEQGESFVSFVYPRSRVTYPTLSSALGFSVTESFERGYIGQYTDYVKSDGSDPAMYKWSLIKGDKGDKGEQGLQGVPGKDGKSAFILRLEHTEGTVIGGKVNGFIFLKLRPSYGGEEIQITDETPDPDKEINFKDTTILYNLGDGWNPLGAQSLEMQCLPINGHEAPKGVRVMATAKYKGMVASDTLYIPNLPDPKVLEKVESGLTNANTALKSLKEASEKMITSDKIKWLLDAYNNGKTTVAGGLILSKIIALSNDVDRITAYLSGYDAAGGDGKILRAGIRYEQVLAPTGKRVRRKWIDAIAWAIDARMGVGTAAKVFNAYPYNDYDATEVEFKHWKENIRDNFNIDIDDVIADLRNYNAVLDMSADPYEESPAQWYYEMDLYEATHTDSGSENVAIRHDGTGHFGDIHFAGDRIDYIDQATGEAYLSVGNVVNESIQDVVRKNSVDRTVTLSSASGIREGNVSMAGRFTIENDNTRVFLQYDLAVGYDRDTPSGRKQGGYAEMRIKNTSNPNADPWIITTPAYSGLARYGTFEKAMVNMRAGEYVVEVRSIGPYTSTGYRNFTVRQVYTSALKQSFITPRGIRFYGSPQKFVDFDYSATGPGLTIGGGLSIDYIDTPGIPLAGATFDSGGGEVKALGRYKNKRDSSFASAYYDYSTQSYKVYHSIPHDKYIPLVTPFGAMGNNENWNLSVRVYEVRAYYFTIKLLTNNDNSTKNGFSYVAFQAE